MEKENNNPIQNSDEQEDNNPIQEKSRKIINHNEEVSNSNINNTTRVAKGSQYNNYAENYNDAKSDKKKSKAPIIIVAVIIIVLLLGCLVSSAIFFGINFVEKYSEKSLNKSTYNSLNSTITDTIKNNIENNNLNNDTNNIITENEEKANKQNLLSKGEWGIASKYSVQAREYENINVKVTNFIRGEEAKNIVKDNTNSSIYKYEEPKEGLEWVVIEYDVDFADYKMTSLGANADISGSVEGTESIYIKYNEKTYFSNTRYIGSREYVKTNTTSGKIAAQIPIGCTDYVVKFGSYGQTNAYFKGE